MSHTNNDTASLHEELSIPVTQTNAAAVVYPKNQDSAAAPANNATDTHAASAGNSESTTLDSDSHVNIGGASAATNTNSLTAENKLDQNSHLKRELAAKIHEQGQVQAMLVTEINSKTISLDRLQQIKSELETNVQIIHGLYDRIRVSVADKDVSQLVDKLTHDNRLLADSINQLMNEMTVRPRDLRSIRSGSRSYKSAFSGSSQSSARSSGSSILRMRAAEAAARAAEMKAKLITEKQTGAIERQMVELECAKREAQLQGELAAEQQKVAIFQQALNEEEHIGSGLLLPAQSTGSGPMLTNNQSPVDDKTPIPYQLPIIDPPDTSSHTNKNPRNVDRVLDAVMFHDTPDEAELRNPMIQVETNTPVSPPQLPKDNQSLSDVSHITHGLAEAVATAINMSRLPPPEPFIFDGNPLTYTDWVFAFDGLIGNKQCSIVEKLHYLKRYVSGKALEVVDGYFLLQSQDAYYKAKAELKKRFGDPYTVSEAFRSKIERWAPIKDHDSEGLRRYSDFLRQCETAKNTLKELSILDDSRENKKMLQKLPEWLGKRWVRYVTIHQQDTGAFPDFAKFCRFLAKEAKIACNPLILDLHTNVKHSQAKTEFWQNPRKSTLATQNHNHIESNSDNKTSSKQCLYCDMSNHATAKCGKVNRLPFKEQREFLRNNHLCFACLDGNHGYKECQSPGKCDICKGEHPTALHKLRTTPYNQKPQNISENQGSNQEPPFSSRTNSGEKPLAPPASPTVTSVETKSVTPQ